MSWAGIQGLKTTELEVCFLTMRLLVLGNSVSDISAWCDKVGGPGLSMLPQSSPGMECQPSSWPTAQHDRQDIVPVCNNGFLLLFQARLSLAITNLAVVATGEVLLRRTIKRQNQTTAEPVVYFQSNIRYTFVY